MKTEKIIELLTDNLEKVEPLKHPLIRASMWLVLTVSFVLLLTLIIGVREDIGDVIKSQEFIVEMLAALATGLLAALSAHWLAVPDARQQKWIVWLPVIPLSIFLFMVVYQYLMRPMSVDDSMHQSCISNVLLFISLPSVLLFMVLKKAAATRIQLTSLMAVISVLAFAYFCTRLICQQDNLEHLLLWHYLPIVVLTFTGAFLGAKILRW